MIKYSVYWYKLKEHTDKYSQGYIGITNDLQRRHKEHRYSANPKNKTFIDTHFTRAINKYGLENIIKEVLHSEVTLQEAMEYERKYRPNLNIGWNCRVGGEISQATSIFKGITNRWTTDQKTKIGQAHKGKTISKDHIEILREKNRNNENLGTKISLYHKNNYVILYTFHSISEASRQLNLPLSRLKSKNLRKHSSYGEDGWAILFDPMFDRSQTPTGRELAGINASKTLQLKHNKVQE